MRRDEHAARQKGRQWGDFTLLWSASAVSQLGSTCVATANPLLALYLTHSAIFAGWMAAAGTLPILLMYLPAGWLADRFSRRKLMLVSQIGRLAVCTPMAVALYAGHFRISLLIVAPLCEGSLLVVYNAAELTAIQRVVNAEQLSPALAMNEARTHAALMTGKPLGGFLFGIGQGVPYLADLVSSLWALASLGLMRSKNYQPAKVQGQKPSTSLRDGLKHLVHSPFLRTVIVVCATCNFLFQTMLLLLLVQAEQRHMSSTTIGLLLASTGIGGLVGSAIGSKTRVVRQERLIRCCVAVWTLLALVVAMSPAPWVGMLAWGCLSITGGQLNVAVKTYQTTRVPPELLGRVTGIHRFLTSGGVPLGALCGGYIVEALSPRGASVLVVAVLAAVGLFVVPTLFHPGRRLGGIVGWVKRHIPAPQAQHAPQEELSLPAPKELAPVG